MAYCTQQDLVDRFGAGRLIQLTDRTNTPATTIDGTVVAKHIGDATSLIDSYVGKRYALPLGNVPAVLTKVAVDLAWYFLLGPSASKDGPEAMARAEAVRWLEAVSKGLAVIDDAGLKPAQAGGGQIKIAAPARVMSRDSLRGL